MDDFGSGYSSLSMLKNLEVDTIKLDKSFFATKDMSYEKEKIIVKNIIDMAKALNISTVAELKHMNKSIFSSIRNVT